MPKDFNRCIKNGGKVWTVSGPNKKYGLKEDEYVHFCKDDKGVHMGHVKKKKGKNNLEDRLRPRFKKE